mmetsp:Transcript_60485/g.131103  ORF Transcript_60485/g.131103 Transcript_60485/m.131103 type:complete len:240 (+) Transcript_60485:233-952(+)
MFLLGNFDFLANDDLQQTLDRFVELFVPEEFLIVLEVFSALLQIFIYFNILVFVYNFWTEFFLALQLVYDVPIETDYSFAVCFVVVLLECLVSVLCKVVEVVFDDFVIVQVHYPQSRTVVLHQHVHSQLFKFGIQVVGLRTYLLQHVLVLPIAHHSFLGLGHVKLKFGEHHFDGYIQVAEYVQPGVRHRSRLCLGLIFEEFVVLFICAAQLRHSFEGHERAFRILGLALVSLGLSKSFQ